MGYDCHHAIVVSSHDGRERMSDKAHAKATELFGPLVSPIIDSGTNGVRSFFIAPDGSKEGWPESDRGDEARQAFIQWIDAQRWDMLVEEARVRWLLKALDAVHAAYPR